MTDRRRLPPAGGDPLSDAMRTLPLGGTLCCNAELTAPWGIVIPELPGCLTFAVVTHGSCWLRVGDRAPAELERGSLTLLPHAIEHTFSSTPDGPGRPLFDLPVDIVNPRFEQLRHGGGGALTRIAYGAVNVHEPTARRFLDRLPDVIHARTLDLEEQEWIEHSLRLMARESHLGRAGSETIVTRLVDVLMIQAVRSWLDTSEEGRAGVLAALRDPWIGRAITAVHREPGADWDVARLAREAGMSRSAFAARFTELVGTSAKAYVTGWRLESARDDLRRGESTVSAVAERYGYRSDAAFARAFRRAFGESPGSLRRTAAVSR